MMYNSNLHTTNSWNKVFNELENICNHKNSNVVKLFIEFNLRRYHLFQYSTEDILAEIYIRSRQLQEEKPSLEILSPKAWIRGVALNLIREKYRSEKLFIFSKNYPVEDLQDLQEENDDILDFQILNSKALKNALNKLDKQDIDILEKKVIQGLSWKEIEEQINLKGDINITISSLRKRKERALKRLRSLLVKPQGDTITRAPHLLKSF